MLMLKICILVKSTLEIRHILSIRFVIFGMGVEEFNMLTPSLQKSILNKVWLSIQCALLCKMSLYRHYVRYDSKLVNDVIFTI